MIDALKRLLARRFRISTQLYLGLGGAVALTLTASLVGWFSFERVGDAQSRVNESSVPEMEGAFKIAQQSGTLAAAAPRLAAATPEDFAWITARVAEEQKAFEAQLTALVWRGIEEARFERVRVHGGALISNLKTIEASVAERFSLGKRSEALRAELAELQSVLAVTLVPAIDDQLFYAMTGYRHLGEAPAPREQFFSEVEFNRYRHLAELQTGATVATQILGSAFTLSDGALLEPLRERFETTAGRIERSLSALGSIPLRSEVAPACARLIALGLGDQGGFDLRARELEVAERQQRLLTRNREIAVELVADVEGLVSVAHLRAQQATQVSAQAARTGRGLLLVLNVSGIVGALLIAWLFVGRVLRRRLEGLSERMRRLAGGDLAEKVEISGRDEIADMAAALEIFRRHALEVQRLNLVEKLAEELKDKNAQLERALADLHRAQDQIVMREKLAALGELTAGVAHEIRNPLNFVKNFSEVSSELLELRETLRVSYGVLGEEQQELIFEIIGDLTGNLERVRGHGERANQIVHHMLMMGRGSGERQMTDINALLNEHAQLAYHSARATDPDFRLDITEDFDPQMRELEVVPQAMGRVFLNMVSNACHATDEKRHRLEAFAKTCAEPDTGEANFGYEPALRLTTGHRGNWIEIRLRDNGSGIAPDTIDKIFNPFFTTKPTDQGTGLGLALSNDIVREHGGSIRVDSEPNVFTEMIISLPATSERLADDALPPSRTDKGITVPRC